MKTFTTRYRTPPPKGTRTLPCVLGVHAWTPWKAHELPCGAGDNVTEHAVRRCTRCEQRDNRITYTEE